MVAHLGRILPLVVFGPEWMQLWLLGPQPFTKRGDSGQIVRAEKTSHDNLPWQFPVSSVQAGPLLEGGVRGA